MQRDTLLFIDPENISLSMRQYLHREFEPRELIDVVGGWTRLVAAHAYLDMRKQSFPDKLRRRMVAAGFDLRDVPPRGNGRKDLVDHELAADLVEASVAGRSARIVLASGDGHYLPALLRALRYGREIFVAAVQGGLSNDLVSLVGLDHVLLLQGGRPLREAPHAHGRVLEPIRSAA